MNLENIYLVWITKSCHLLSSQWFLWQLLPTTSACDWDQEYMEGNDTDRVWQLGQHLSVNIYKYVALCCKVHNATCTDIIVELLNHRFWTYHKGSIFHGQRSIQSRSLVKTTRAVVHQMTSVTSSHCVIQSIFRWPMWADPPRQNIKIILPSLLLSPCNCSLETEPGDLRRDGTPLGEEGIEGKPNIGWLYIVFTRMCTQYRILQRCTCSSLLILFATEVASCKSTRLSPSLSSRPMS